MEHQFLQLIIAPLLLKQPKRELTPQLHMSLLRILDFYDMHTPITMDLFQVRFDCAPGLAIHGAKMLECLPTGYWSGSVPTCGKPAGA